LASALAATLDCRRAAESLGKAPEADLLSALYAQRFQGRSAVFPGDPSLMEMEEPELLSAVIELCPGSSGGDAARQALQTAPPSAARALFLPRAPRGR
jgi:hypothetical protein